MRRIAVTGSASGIGAAIRARLEAGNAKVIGVDLHDAEVTADLSRPEGRAAHGMHGSTATRVPTANAHSGPASTTRPAIS